MGYSFWECIDRARPHWRAPWGRWFWDRAARRPHACRRRKPRGYFELLSIVRANDDLLAHFGVAGQPADLPHDWTKEDVAIQFVDAQRAALGESLGTIRTYSRILEFRSCFHCGDRYER